MPPCDIMSRSVVGLFLVTTVLSSLISTGYVVYPSRIIYPSGVFNLLF